MSYSRCHQPMQHMLFRCCFSVLDTSIKSSCLSALQVACAILQELGKRLCNEIYIFQLFDLWIGGVGSVPQLEKSALWQLEPGNVISAQRIVSESMRQNPDFFRSPRLMLVSEQQIWTNLHHSMKVVSSVLFALIFIFIFSRWSRICRVNVSCWSCQREKN